MVYSKMKALGYSAYHLNSISSLYYNKEKIVFFGKDGKMNVICESSKKYGLYVKVNRNHDMFEIVLAKKGEYHKETRYCIDSNNNLFKADIAIEDDDIWISMGDNRVLYYNKKNKKKQNIRLDGLNYTRLVESFLYRSRRVLTIVDDRCICVADLILDLEKGEVIRTLGRTYVHNGFIYFRHRNDEDNIVDMFYSFEHRKFFTCNKIKYNYKRIATGVSGYYKDEASGEIYKVAVEENADRYGKLIKALASDNTNLLYVYDTSNGFIINEV